MARITPHLSADILAVVRKRAGRKNRIPSERVRAHIHETDATEWPESLVELLNHGSADLVEPYNPLLEDAGAFVALEGFRV